MQQVIPKFSKHEIMGEIGHGGMGHVYKARHIGLDKLRAINNLPTHIPTKNLPRDSSSHSNCARIPSALTYRTKYVSR